MAKSNPASGIREIKNGNVLLAVFYSKIIKADGATFLTPEEFSLQVGILEHPDGKEVALHAHPEQPRRIRATEEFLYVEKGEVEVTVASADWRPVETLTLTSGDSILFVSGAHGMKIKPGSRLIEVKQGPYPGKANAKKFQK